MLKIILLSIKLLNIFVKLWYILKLKRNASIACIATFCNIINIFTDTFDQFNASLLSKTINLV